MNRKLSNWSAPGERPPCVGVWETNDTKDIRIGGLYNYWNGKKWMGSAYSPSSAYLCREFKSCLDNKNTRFRGLAEKPE